MGVQVVESAALTRLVPDCEDCNDTKFIHGVNSVGAPAVRPCLCRFKSYIERKIAELPMLFRGATFEKTIPNSPGQKRFMEMLKQNPAGSFFIHGQYDQGKSHLLAVQYRMLIERGRKCFWRTSEELVEELQRHEVEKGFKSEILEALRGENFHLFWDDCDKVDWDRTPFRREAVGRVVNTIHQATFGLSITTNCSLQELISPPVGEAKLPQYVISRIERICRRNFIEI